MNSFRTIAIGGMVSPVIYTLMWILGGILVPEYSHIHNDVSTLFAIGAPLRWLFQSMAICSSILLLAFYSILHRVTPGRNPTGPILYFGSALLGVVVASFFPLDAGGEIATWRGKSHLILIAISGVLVIVAMVMTYFRLRVYHDWQSFSLFQLISAPVLLAGVIIMIPFAGSEYMGLVERFMVSAYQVFYFLSGCYVLAHISANSRKKEARK